MLTKPTTKVYALLLGLSLLLTCSALAQFSSERIITACEVCSPTDVFSADLDGDGDMDVLSASDGDDKIAWYENDGRGNFSEQNIIDTQAIKASSVYAADLDGDGDMDVLSAATWGDKIAWYENDGRGNFSAQKIISTQAKGAKEVYAADLDGDGDMDVLSASNNDDKIAWYENDGRGNFSAQKIISTQANGAQDVYATDLDGDGDMDVLSASNIDDKIAWYENDGNGGFSGQNIITTQANSAASVYAADLDGDGDMDVLSASLVDNKIAWYENDGRGNFSEQNLITPQVNRPQTIYATDLDGDGDMDVLSVPTVEVDGKIRYENASISWYENDGRGNFGERIIPNPNQAFFVQSVYAADIDGDGDMDILSASRDDNKIAWYENDGRGNFSEQMVINTITLNPQSIYATDLDGDGDKDVLSASEGDDKIAWYENDGSGNFSKQQIITTQADDVQDVYAADLDGDGDMDVLSASIWDGKIAWYENDGRGNFSEQKIITTQSFGSQSVYASDLDGDGDMDVLSASQGDDKVVWYENDGRGNFSAQKILTTEDNGASSVYATDLDGDGDMDVLYASLGGQDPLNGIIWESKIAWQENDGSGNFSTQKIISTEADYTESIDASDLDGDGDMDVLSASSNDNKIAWYENDGSGNFSAQKIINAQANRASSVYTADLDRDGDIDVLSASRNDAIIAWYENDGKGNFSEQTIIGTQVTEASSVYAADLDGDGYKDILAASLRDDKITWYKNLFNEPTLSGITFWDENENGMKDSSEAILRNISVDIIPTALSSYTDPTGTFRFYVANNTAYLVTAFPDTCWQLTTSTSSYTVNLSGDVAQDLDFGFRLAAGPLHTQARVHSCPTRCGFDVKFWPSVENDACQPAKGQYGLVLSPLVTLKEAEIEPDEIRGDTLLWNYEDLASSEVQDLLLIFEIAGTDFIGEIIELTALSYIENEIGELELSSTYIYQSEIRCAYDPNDKLVQPNRLQQYDENYTLFEETLEYTIRFQNTGNDTAFNVVLRDTLDENLDWTTFKPITASHTFETLLSSKNGAVQFSFKDILLPDSTTNELGSQGFVSYKIKPKKDLAENTPIENTASIYFDFNPPIVTNTTQNVLVSELPKTTSINEFVLNQTIKIYPNPFGDIITIESLSPLKDRPILSIFDARGRVVSTVVLQNATQQISTTHFGKGLYFYRVIDEAGRAIGNGKMLKQ